MSPKILRFTSKPLIRLVTQDYLSNRVIQKPEELYSGLARISVSDDEFRSLGRLLYSNGGVNPQLPVADIAGMVGLPTLSPNQCCVFASEGEERGKELLALYKYNKGMPYFRCVPKPHSSNGNVHPRNSGQALSHALLIDPEITLVALSGIAGGGKSLMALLAGREQTGKLGGKSLYSQMCICRSNYEMGKGLGYLKGTLVEKWAPWARPMLYLLELLDVKTGDLDKMIDGTDPEIQIMPINFIQGCSLNKRFMILDEAQNFNREEVKAFICRAGEGTKVVLTGDITQIVNSSTSISFHAGCRTPYSACRARRTSGVYTWKKVNGLPWRNKQQIVCSKRSSILARNIPRGLFLSMYYLLVLIYNGER